LNISANSASVFAIILRTPGKQSGRKKVTAYFQAGFFRAGAGNLRPNILSRTATDLLRGALGTHILKALSALARHGYGVGQRIQQLVKEM
jgi:hypothetical protein